MSDLYPLTAPVVRADGAELTQNSVQLAFNQLAGAVRIFLNQIGTGGTFINPTITGGTIDNVVVGGLVPAAGTFTTLSASSLTLSSALSVANGGTGQTTLTARAVLIGEGTSNVAFAAPGAAGQMLLSTGAASDPAFGNNPTITGGTINNATVGATTPSTGAFTTLSAITPVGVASGGTGRSTLTNHGVLVGQAAAAINQTTAGTTGQMLLGVTGADPAFGNNPTITGGTVDNAVIGGTTRAAGSFTTVSATGTITPDQLNGIVGTTTNNNANAGSVGELLSNTTSATSLTTTTPANGTSVSLTAGDWEVSGTVRFNPAGTTTVSAIIVGLNNVSATFNAALGMVNQLQTAFTTGQTQLISTPVIRFSLASTTTVFLVVQSNFATSTMTADGFIRARRVR